MASLWPVHLRREIRIDPLRRAEVLVYDKLAACLPDGWTVWYSRPWLGLTSTGAERDGEADFIIAHPGSGILVLEVKGGTIALDPRTDAWTSRDRAGIVHSIKNPIAQARTSKYEILRKLKLTPGWRERRLRLMHGVIFPDSAVPPRALAMDAPRDIFCDAHDFRGDLLAWIEHRLGRPDARSAEVALGKMGIDQLTRILAAPIMLHTPMALLVEDDERTFRELTVQQYHLLELLSQTRRAAIAGPAGTGKTVLALEKARRSVAAGRRTLVTCFNRPLAELLAKSLSGLPVDVFTFSAFCGHAARAAGLQVPASADQHEIMDRVLPELLMDAVSHHSWLGYDTIVVDEGQDFAAHWWAALEATAKGASDTEFYVFHDDNQALYDDDARGIPHHADLAPFRLSRNLRNTRLIHAGAIAHYSGGLYEAIGPEGRSIEWVSATDEATCNRQAGHVLGRLIEGDRLNPEEIGVLLYNDRSVEVFRTRHSRFRPVRLGEMGGGITVDTIRRFKGLERSVIVLVADDRIVDEPELAYVALSRPRSHLVVVGSAKAVTFLRSDLLKSAKS